MEKFLYPFKTLLTVEGEMPRSADMVFNFMFLFSLPGESRIHSCFFYKENRFPKEIILYLRKKSNPSLFFFSGIF